MRATNQECHGQELNQVPPAHEASALRGLITQVIYIAYIGAVNMAE